MNGGAGTVAAVSSNWEGGRSAVTELRVGAVQLRPVLADVDANLEACERLAGEAAARGAEWIVLPEFFTTGMAFDQRLAEASLPPDGPATRLLLDLARRHGAVVGGSFLCRDPDGHVRNAFFLATPDGLAGRHDKDAPTMWENAFYVGGDDEGVLHAAGLAVGVALCWEFMRSRTARRLRGKVDLVLGGSCWWSVPDWFPRGLTRAWERRNAATALEAVRTFARLVGAPVVHAAHCGSLECPTPWLPRYRGHFEGGAEVVDAAGRVLARRGPEEGPGVVVATVEVGGCRALDPLPGRFWLHRRGFLPALAWNYQMVHGRSWYRRHVGGRRPAAPVNGPGPR